MNLRKVKRIAADVLKCGINRVQFDTERNEDIKEVITKADVKRLIKDNAIKAAPLKSTSRVRARKTAVQKRKGRRRNAGSVKGKFNARLNSKKAWMNGVRAQRALLKELAGKELITKSDYHSLYSKVKGGFFRSKRHIKLYLDEHELVKKK